MNILFYLHKYPSYGGIENVTTYLANYLVSTDYQVSIYSFVGIDFDLLLSKLDSRINYIQACEKEDYYANVNFDQLSNLIKNKKIDVVIFQDSYAPVERMLWRIKGDFPKLKVITVEHNTPDAFLKALRYEKPSFKLEWIKRKILYPLYYCKVFYSIKNRHLDVYNESDKYILLTSKFTETFKRITGLTNLSKLTAINNPITISTPSEILWENKRKICLFPARLVGQKGIGMLMKIWHIVESKIQDWDLYIVGDGPERKVIEENVKVYGLKHIRLEGFQSEMQPYYEKASILMATSIYEGWPLTLSESMAYGNVPIVFDSYLAATEIVEDGYSGFVVPPFNIELYAKKMIYLMENYEFRMNLAKNALQTSARFKIETIGKQWSDVLKEIMYDKQ